MNILNEESIQPCEIVSDMVMSVMGVDKLAYIKPVQDAYGLMEYVVHAADGTPLASFESSDEASFSIRKHNLTPVNIH